MHAKLTNRSVEQAIAAIEALDLESIKLRVIDAESGEGWTSEYADRIERGYRNYLRVLVKHPEDIEDIAVSKEVDEFWHAHILHTRKYTEDCAKVFGAYLHHNPHVGARTPADVAAKARQVERTRSLYERGGATVYGADVAFCSAGIEAKQAAFCSASVSPDTAAFCSAAIGAKQAAFCSAAVRASGAAFCSASVSPDVAAFCSAAIGAKQAAFCSAAVAPGRAVTQKDLPITG